MIEMPAPSDRWKKLETAFGGVQLRAMERAVALAAGVKPGVTPCGVAYVSRPHRRGVPLVAVHGFGGDKETWLLMAPWLPRRWRTVLLDLPGHGASSAMRDASARAQAAVLAGFLDHLGIERAVIAGNSMGGGIALRFARDYPDRVRGLVLVASVAAEVVPNELTAALDRGENLLVPDSHDKTDEFLRTVTARPPRVPRAVQRYVTSERVARQAQLDTFFRAWRAAADVPADLEAISAPTLVIHGALDRIVHPATADLLTARLPRARRVILSGIGHVPQLEAPSAVARLIAAFCAGL